MLAAGILGTLMSQSAFRAGALSVSLPVIDTLEPISAVVIGAWVFGERLAASPGQLAAHLAGGAVAAAGIATLSRSSVATMETSPQFQPARPPTTRCKSREDPSNAPSGRAATATATKAATSTSGGDGHARFR
jgi:hypothetical protein